jgi:hypothetical protein
MSPLENAIQEQLGLANKGYSVEQIQCAALQVIAERLSPEGIGDLVEVLSERFEEYQNGAD